MATDVLFLLADQFRAMCLEDDPVRTPNLDALADGGLRLTQAVSCYPVCSPHRAMLMTGQHPSRNGVPMNVNSRNNEFGVGLRDGVATWPQALRDAGYQTGYIGKWHLEPPDDEDERHGEGRRSDGMVWDACSPPERRFGFDFWYSYGCCDAHLTPHYWATDSRIEERIDVGPTLLGLCGVPVPGDMQGRNLAPVLLEEAGVDDDEASLYYRWPTPHDSWTARGLRTRRWKFVAVQGTDGGIELHLYDLAADPYELTNLDDPGLCRELAERMLAELAAVGESWEGEAALRAALS